MVARSLSLALAPSLFFSSSSFSFTRFYALLTSSLLSFIHFLHIWSLRVSPLFSRFFLLYRKPPPFSLFTELPQGFLFFLIHFLFVIHPFFLLFASVFLRGLPRRRFPEGLSEAASPKVYGVLAEGSAGSAGDLFGVCSFWIFFFLLFAEPKQNEIFLYFWFS